MDRVNDDGGEKSTHHEISRPSLARCPTSVVTFPLRDLELGVWSLRPLRDLETASWWLRPWWLRPLLCPLRE